MGNSSRYKSLDAWRGIACLMVVLLHAWPHAYPGRKLLHFGVDMFFVISGYCISATAESSLRRGDGIGAYFRRRFRRIYPPYWIFLAATTLFMLTPIGSTIIDDRDIHDPHLLSTGAWIGNITLSETWLSTARGVNPMFIAAIAWTLCYEEQFYAIVGILLIVCPRHFFAGSIAVTVFSLIAYGMLPRFGISVRGSFLDLSWLTFAAGIWTYYMRVYAQGREKWLLWSIPLAGIAFSFRHPDRPDWEIGASFVFASVLVALSPFDEKIARAVRPLTWCGLMCYSLYLVHFPLSRWIFTFVHQYGPLVTIVISTAASLTLAAVFHVAVERRFLNSKPAPLKLTPLPFLGESAL